MSVAAADAACPPPPASPRNVASTFDKDLMRRHGQAIGEEARGKGVNIWLGPCVNIARSPLGGRIWEAQGADPYLSGVSAARQIDGVQSQGVIATVKHFILNDQEYERNTQDSIIDDRTLREVYMKPFQMAVDAGVGAVMTSYNKVAGEWAGQSKYVITDLLKNELGFKGIVMTDWWAVNTVKANGDAAYIANSGLDMLMPGNEDLPDPTSVWGDGKLARFVADGRVAQARLDDMATRVLAAWIKAGQNDGTFPSCDVGISGRRDVQANHKDVIREVGAASSVLLKNDGSLPLAKPLQKIAVIGSDAAPPKDGIYGNAGKRPGDKFSDHGCVDGTVAMGWGSGTAYFPYIVAPIDGIKSAAADAGIDVVASLTDSAEDAAKVAAEADIAVVFVHANSGEGYITYGETLQGDRLSLNLWDGGNELVVATARVQKTVVVIHAPGAVNLPWRNLKNVVGIIFAGFPGQETGNAIADVLFGKVNPSGRLPYTVNDSESDYGTAIIKDATNVYTEGFFFDYRRNDKFGIAPAYEFGFGLSYTTFAYANAAVSRSSEDGAAAVVVSVDVTNTGAVDGKEVVQVYLSLPSATVADAPKKILAAFECVRVRAGETVTVALPLAWRELSAYLDGKWVVPDGVFEYKVGASSADIRAGGVFEVRGGAVVSV
ncbi:hypothetical protein HDU83_006589 [Entophlyctis luteolus]|nr:hypothetical protein HDU83_006589 [Entophlyctis luteolus]